MPAHVHALVQDADDDKARFIETVEHKMGTDEVFEITLADIDRMPGSGKPIWK